jgi:hypothetical protein
MKQLAGLSQLRRGRAGRKTGSNQADDAEQPYPSSLILLVRSNLARPLPKQAHDVPNTQILWPGLIRPEAGRRFLKSCRE